MKSVGGAGTNSVILDFTASYTKGYIRVSTSNCKGTSSQRSVYLYSIPATPTPVTGAINGVCAGTSGVPYSVTPVLAATSYNWTAPVNATIATGQGTTNVTVDYNASFTTGTLKVTADNVCGVSGIRSTTVRSIPVTPGTIFGAATVCANQTGVAYSIAAVAGATSYAWTVPVGAVVANGQGSNSIIVNFGTASGKVSVRSVNACGQSTLKNFTVTINCRQTKAISELTLFPNPAQDKVSISFYADEEGDYRFELTDVTGRLVYETSNHATEGMNTTESNLSDLTKGVYMFSCMMNGEQVVKKIVVE